MITVETHKKLAALRTFAVLSLPMKLIFGCIFTLQQISLAAQTTTIDSLSDYDTTQDDKNFLTYMNSAYGIQLQYPSNWINFTDRSGNISFLPVPKNNSGSEYIVGVNMLHLPSYFSSSINIVNFIVDSYEKTINNFELIESSQTYLGNNSAQKIIYTYTIEYPYSIPIKALEILTTKSNKAYIISFATEASQFSSHLSTVQKVINSFEIIDTGQEIFPLNESKDGKQQKNFLTYENSNHRIKMQYPSLWDVEEIDRNQNDSIIHVVQFYSPKENFLEIYPESLEISINTLLLSDDNKNSTLDKYADEVVKNYSRTLPEFQLVKLNKNSRLADSNSAYELIYTAKIVDVFNRISGFDYKAIEIGAIIGHNVFKINYYAPQNEFPDLLPIIKKMIDSFEIDKSVVSDEDIEDKTAPIEGRFI
jgi:hypothetical protein